MNRKIVFISAALALIAAFAVAVSFYAQQQEQAANELAQANRAALVRMHSPSMGNPAAPVVIVEFLDPACETCAAFYPRVKALMAQHPQRIRLVLRYAPFHPGSDKVIALLEAARKQGKLWPALETLLASQATWAPQHTADARLAWAQLDGLGLNLEQLALDVSAPDIAAVIAQDSADAAALNVTKTPTFFVNGRPLPSFGYAPLQALVDQALSAVR